MKKLIVFLLLLQLGHLEAASSFILEKEITANLQQVKTVVILEELERQGNFHFSYSSDLINTTKLASLVVKRRTVRECLFLLFSGTLDFRQKGNYLIVSASKVPSNSKQKVIKGYVRDQANGNRVSGVSVFEKQTFASAITNQDGYFELKLNQPSDTTFLEIRKLEFRDTLILSKDTPDLKFIEILKENFGLTSKDSADITNALNEVKKFGNQIVEVSKQLTHRNNIKDSLFRKQQYSLLPFISNNGYLAANIKNDYTFSLLGGISNGNTKGEFGAGFNIDLGEVKGTQIAGITNVNSKGFEGLQIAGLSNIQLGKIKGLQACGLANINLQSFEGLQASGLININNQAKKGPQFAGLLNINRNAIGVSFAGLGNIHSVESKNVDFAGLFNVANSNTSSIRVAGLFNTSKAGSAKTEIAGLFNVSGTKASKNALAGLFNYATSQPKGIQIAGLFNYADTSNGVQLAPFNFSKNGKGFPIGVVSIVGNGVHQFDYNYSSLQTHELKWRTGVPMLVNELFAGIRNVDFQNPVWYAGYGLGSGAGFKHKVRLDYGISTAHWSQGDFSTRIAFLNTIRAGLEYRPIQKLAFYFNFLANMWVIDPSSEVYSLVKQNLPSYMWLNEAGSRVEVKGFLGWKAGIRLF